MTIPVDEQLEAIRDLLAAILATQQRVLIQLERVAGRELRDTVPGPTLTPGPRRG